MQSYITKNKELTNFFKKFFGSSLTQAYISVPTSDVANIEQLKKKSENVSSLFKDIKDCMNFDPGCVIVLQFSDMTFVEIDPASHGSPMSFSVFNIHNSIIVD
jgi:hypothetical protein